MGYNAKQRLYNFVDNLRIRCGLRLCDCPIDALTACNKLVPTRFIHHKFESNGFCGAAFIGDKENTIVLNTNRSKTEQNFDCGHELIHLSKHRNKNQGAFQCFTKNQNTFLEWEANEGSAQLLIPYQDFIPRFLAIISDAAHRRYYGVHEILADYYHVSPRVIEIRISSLSYEIDQYRTGTPIDKIEILSKTERKNRRITTTHYNAVCAFPLDWEAAIG